MLRFVLVYIPVSVVSHTLCISLFIICSTRHTCFSKRYTCLLNICFCFFISSRIRNYF
ncbi:Defensin-like protein 302 [Arabidopsis thaliana]|uniref:Defensin-like protein 302 n=4 Tax=Arabidopsis TaxID=3701 RepID=DF302_ARATH|nr:Defensin-like (DEFL) family protein [Arabidopsis thaliana]Q2V3W5.1 PUTATIVE PSEUDOGENE: RecName: Full=Defensin-like protein 302 [Arabidopsis thaliana]KAG7625066.1 hypothetical protein ISN45_At03g013370 [Arabidopsis thaliana x Arabidopsis arenosa]KAG7631087.1 hypothetical protein ISN44_As03g013440 [Arabidopsis suecica]AEE75344.1 Defensin-like (DEFL) family protein [Arabidopsis thaliana]CAA0382285.1 unnamed protein product [Arabidopsis thaliana]VYS57233.1 unnamed protein product [Arabidopsis|eukprot:NP_001030686.1 Defensin-like (DEFL) family protein [Arabidopsis thaliana]